MKIATTTLGCDGGISGIGRYAASLLSQWIDSGSELTIFGHAIDRSAFIPEGSSVNWQDVAEKWKRPLQSIFWHQTALPTLSSGADILFLPAGNRRLSAHYSVPCVATVHDCSSLHIAGKYDRARDLYIKRVLPWLMQRLDHVITVSESTKADLIGFCGIAAKDITVIPLAADRTVFFPRNRERAESHLQQRYGITGPYLLYIARIEHPGKNHAQILSAWETLKRRHAIRHQLVFVGPDKERSEEVHRLAAQSPFAADVVFTGAVPADDLPLFYSAADLFVFPSLYEGFGLPILEALACGTPVACSDRSSLPEVGGESVLLFDPEDPACIASSILQILGESNADRCARIASGLDRAAQFSWQRTAHDTMVVLERVGGR